MGSPDGRPWNCYFHRFCRVWRYLWPQVWEPLWQSNCPWLPFFLMKLILCRAPSEALCCRRTGCSVGQNRLSPCKFRVKGHNFTGSHLSPSQRHFRLFAATGEGIRSRLNWDNPSSGYILWPDVCQLTFSPCIYNCQLFPCIESWQKSLLFVEPH